MFLIARLAQVAPIGLFSFLEGVAGTVVIRRGWRHVCECDRASTATMRALMANT
jgi:hypothetical protein